MADELVARCETRPGSLCGAGQWSGREIREYLCGESIDLVEDRGLIHRVKLDLHDEALQAEQLPQLQQSIANLGRLADQPAALGDRLLQRRQAPARERLTRVVEIFGEGALRSQELEALVVTWPHVLQRALASSPLFFWPPAAKLCLNLTIA